MKFKQWLETNDRNILKAFEEFAQQHQDSQQRLHISKLPIDGINEKSQDLLPGYFRMNGKPFGFWYGIGTEWMQFVLREHESAIGNYIYLIDIEPSKILFIQNSQQVQQLEKDYGVWSDFKNNGWHSDNGIQKLIHGSTGKTTTHPKLLKWSELSKLYAGVEMNPHKIHAYFAEEWAVNSGCIWSKNGVKSIKLMAQYNPNSNKYEIN